VNGRLGRLERRKIRILLRVHQVVLGVVTRGLRITASAFGLFPVAMVLFKVLPRLSRCRQGLFPIGQTSNLGRSFSRGHCFQLSGPQLAVYRLQLRRISPILAFLDCTIILGITSIVFLCVSLPSMISIILLSMISIILVGVVCA
jgi:hypothetical protein